MTASPQTLPRFIPTLTQIVEHPSASVIPPERASSTLADTVWHQIEPILRHRVKAEIEQLIEQALVEKSAELQHRLEEEMRLLVQQTVRDTLQCEKPQ